jgi:hypothetical protein
LLDDLVANVGWVMARVDGFKNVMTRGGGVARFGELRLYRVEAEASA